MRDRIVNFITEKKVLKNASLEKTKENKENVT